MAFPQFFFFTTFFNFPVEKIPGSTRPSKSLKQRLTSAVEKLTKEQLELQKQVGPSAHDKLIMIDAFESITSHLQDAETDTVEGNITTANNPDHVGGGRGTVGGSQ